MANTLLLDGKYKRGFYTGRPRITFPFAINGDYATLVIERDWTQSASVFFPGKLGVDRDPYYTTAYLNTETKPEPTGIADVIKTVRSFAIVPPPQLSYGSHSMTKPTIPNEGDVTLSIMNYNVTDTEIATGVRNNTGIFISDDRVFAPFVAISASPTVPVASGGTFTLAYKTSTSAPIAYNANQATTNAALNGLAAVIADGLTFALDATGNLASAGALGFNISAGSTTTGLVLNPAGLTIPTAGGNAPFTLVASSIAQLISLGRVLTVPAHGFSAAKVLLLADASTGIIVPVGAWSIYDANTLQLACPITSGILQTAYGTVKYPATYLRNYTPGTTILAVRITETFYLPGVTAGITTPADIPITVPNISDADIIAAVLTDTGYQPVDFQGPERWMDGVIWKTAKTDVNFDTL